MLAYYNGNSLGKESGQRVHPNHLRHVDDPFLLKVKGEDGLLHLVGGIHLEDQSLLLEEGHQILDEDPDHHLSHGVE